MGSFTVAYDQARFASEYFETNGLIAHGVRARLVMAEALVENAKQGGKEQQSPHLQKAVSLCKEISSQAHQYHLQEEMYRSYYLLGQIFALQEDFTKAARYCGAAIAQIERILDDLVYDLSPSFLQSTWAVYEDMIALCLQQAQVERAFGYLEQARSMALRQYLNKSKAKQSSSIEQEDTVSTSLLQQNNAVILRAQYDLRNEQEQHRYYSVLLADIDLSVSPTVDRAVIQQQLKRCEEKISQLSERLHLYQSDTRLISQKRTRRTRNVKRVDITQLRQSLSPDQILLAYFLYKGRLVIFAATKEQLVTRELPNGVEQLERLLPLLHAHI